MTIEEQSLILHERYKGKLSVTSKVLINTREDLSLYYTPGVAAPCKAIHDNPEYVYKYTNKGNSVAVVTNGTAVLGLGNIGPKAALPVMEGKSVLFKEFADIDAYPICIDTKNVDELVFIIKSISSGFGGINLEDIAAPTCFEVENRLKEALDIPVFHDDQHGTAIVVLAGLLNALKIVGKKVTDIKVVINGAGSAGIAIAKLLYKNGITNILLVKKDGILTKNCKSNNKYQEEASGYTNPFNINGSLIDALKDADVFIGVSAGNVVSKKMIAKMNKDAIVFALANPVPEIMPDLAKAGGARIVATGRSDFPNQINNVLAFPGVFKGALKARAKEISDDMKIAAAYAIAGIVTDNELKEDYIIPNALDKIVVEKVADAVYRTAINKI